MAIQLIFVTDALDYIVVLYGLTSSCGDAFKMIKELSIIFPQNPINSIVGMAGLVEPAQADFGHRCSTPRIELETKSFYGFILILQQMNSGCWIKIPSADGAAASSEWNSTFIAFVEIGRVFLMCF